MIRILLSVAALHVGGDSMRVVDDGYDLWMRYRRIEQTAAREGYQSHVSEVVVPGTSSTAAATRAEIARAMRGMVGSAPVESRSASRDGALLIGTLDGSPQIAAQIALLKLSAALRALGPDGYMIRSVSVNGHRVTMIIGNRDIGALYGTFRFLQRVQSLGSVDRLQLSSAPQIQRNVLDHWDNLDRTVERGYAGRSLWDWEHLPDSLSARYTDYARANASIGINGAVLTNVNANALVLTPAYIAKVAALASVFRPYGVRVYLTARFSAPIEIGKLPTADPLDHAVRQWWKSKSEQLYRAIPDFGGFVVKANSEGQPGPQDYHGTHADGANMLADAVAAHGGVVMWRAFVYSSDVPVDRIKQVYDEFTPLDGTFRDNVMVQVKNGPLDFQPREPFHPLFGAMPKTPLVMEFQITKEYLGEDSHLAYLGPLFEQVLRADTYVNGKGSTVARVIDGSLHHYRQTGIAGVANIGDDRNWTGSVFNQANWFVYGRLAWDPTASSRDIATDWIRLTLSTDPAVVTTVRRMMMMSRDAVVNYMTPLGLAHQMATGHHYGPGPWVDNLRPDWTPVYYHRADTIGLGFDRTATGTNAVAQYAPAVRARFANRRTVSDSLLLFFHHVGWDEHLASGRTLWNELLHRYDAGVDSVHAMQRAWDSLTARIDSTFTGSFAVPLIRVSHAVSLFNRDLNTDQLDGSVSPFHAGLLMSGRARDTHTPVPADHFTFGLWTVGNVGRDPFGDAVRSMLPPTRAVEKLTALGAFGVNLHDEDLVPRDATLAERDRIVREFKVALNVTGLKVPMATTNLFSDPAFRDALDFLCEYSISQGYPYKFALEPKPNEPRGDIFLPTIGHALAFIHTLAHPDMVGVNPEVAHDTISGLDFSHGVAQAIDAGKLFHIDLNAQKPGRYDQDHRFGSEDDDGVWAFAAGSMRTYLILKEKVRRFHADTEIQSCLAELTSRAGSNAAHVPFSAAHAVALKSQSLDLTSTRAKGFGYERLDPLTMELLLGVR